MFTGFKSGGVVDPTPRHADGTIDNGYSFDHGPVAVMHPPGTFECPDWPECQCPDGTFKLECPALGTMYADRGQRRSVWPRIAGYALCGVLLAALLWVMYHSITLPIVYESYTTGNCVRVDDVRGVYTCDNMPRKFHHQWVN
jgi:hypothetical protein